MNRLLILLSVVIVLITSCKKHSVKVKDDYVPKFTSSQLQYRLESSYAIGAIDSLIVFLKNWNTLVPASSDEYINQNDTIRNIYALFSDLYKPYSFGSLGTKTPYKIGNEYVLIPCEIEYNVVSIDTFKILSKDYSLYEDYKSYLLQSFRPVTIVEPKKQLFLTKEYKEALNFFLGTKHSEVGEVDIMNPAQPKDESFNKFKFVRPYLPILEGHWGGYWYLETFPIVYRIIFDTNFKNALVDFRDGYRTIIQYKITKIKDKWIDGSNQTFMIRQE